MVKFVSKIFLININKINKLFLVNGKEIIELIINKIEFEIIDEINE